MRPRSFALALPLAASALLAVAARPARPQALLGTGDAGGHAWYFDTPGVDLPTPAVVELTSLPNDAQPHGVALFGPRLALLADFDRQRLLVVDPLTDTLRRIVPTSPWRGLGTVAISPNGAFALAAGDDQGVSSGLFVIDNPFAAAPFVRVLALPSSQHVHSWQTAAIRFAADGRAFVATHHRDNVFGAASPNASFVHVLDPPYTAIAASIALPVAAATTSNFDHAEGLAVSPDGGVVLVANGDRELYVLRAPFTAGMTVETLDAAAVPVRCGSAVTATPEGAAMLVADYCNDRLTMLPAPYTSVAGAQSVIAAGGAGTGRGFEHVAVSPDGALAYLTGNVVGTAVGDLWVVEAPFVNGAVQHSVTLPADERGAGSVEFTSDKLLYDGFESGDTSVWSAATS
jgi:DNA-binding beta-propeller fold protein YncE